MWRHWEFDSLMLVTPASDLSITASSCGRLCTVSSSLVIWIHNTNHHLQCNVAASTHSWERLQKSYQVELQVYNIFRSVSQTIFIYQWNKTTSGLLWLLEIHTLRKAINVNTRHHWTQDNKTRAESYHQQIFMTFSKAATLVILFSNHSWHEQLLDVSRQKKKKSFSPSDEEMTTLLNWVCSQTFKITGPVGQCWENLWSYCLLTEKLSYIFSVFRQNFIISGPRTS